MGYEGFDCMRDCCPRIWVGARGWPPVPSRSSKENAQVPFLYVEGGQELLGDLCLYCNYCNPTHVDQIQYSTCTVRPVPRHSPMITCQECFSRRLGMSLESRYSSGSRPRLWVSQTHLQTLEPSLYPTPIILSSSAH